MCSNGLLCCGLVQLLEDSTQLGRVLSAPMLSLVLGLALSGLGVLPTSSATYDAVWTYIMPLAASLYMLENDVSRWGSDNPHARAATTAQACMARL
jgi:uncharacterized membrane protein